MSLEGDIGHLKRYNRQQKEQLERIADSLERLVELAEDGELPWEDADNPIR